MHKSKNKDRIGCFEVIIGFIFMSSYVTVCTFLLLNRTPAAIYTTSARVLGALAFAVTLYLAAVVVMISALADADDNSEAAEGDRTMKHVVRLAYLSVCILVGASAYQSYVLLNYFAEIGSPNLPHATAVVAGCAVTGLLYGIFRVLCPTRRTKLTLACELRV